jgi:catechol 2,3-dioxygenase-like lactoylglutathione lyase family enzyme
MTTTTSQSIPPVTHRPVGMHELVLEVANLEASETFYREVIGLNVVSRWTGERKAVWFDAGDTIAIGLWTRETGGAAAIHNGRGGAHVHFALRIPKGSVDTVESRLEALGYETTHIDFDDGNISVYVNDPDNNCVELMDARVDWSNNPIP